MSIIRVSMTEGHEEGQNSHIVRFPAHICADSLSTSMVSAILGLKVPHTSEYKMSNIPTGGSSKTYGPTEPKVSIVLRHS